MLGRSSRTSVGVWSNLVVLSLVAIFAAAGCSSNKGSSDASMRLTLPDFAAAAARMKAQDAAGIAKAQAKIASSPTVGTMTNGSPSPSPSPWPSATPWPTPMPSPTPQAVTTSERTTRIMINISASDMTAPIVKIWENSESMDDTAPKTFDFPNIAKGSNRLIQVLAITREVTTDETGKVVDSGVETFFYGDTTMTLSKPDETADMEMKQIGATDVDAAEGLLTGRLIDAKGVGPTGTVIMKFHPDNGHADMIVDDQSEIYAGWFRLFAHESIPLRYYVDGKELFPNFSLKNPTATMTFNDSRVMYAVPAGYRNVYDTNGVIAGRRKSTRKVVIMGYFGAGSAGKHACYFPYSQPIYNLFTTNNMNDWTTVYWNATSSSADEGRVLAGGYANNEGQCNQNDWFTNWIGPIQDRLADGDGAAGFRGAYRPVYQQYAGNSSMLNVNYTYGNKTASVSWSLLPGVGTSKIKGSQVFWRTKASSAPTSGKHDYETSGGIDCANLTDANVYGAKVFTAGNTVASNIAAQGTAIKLTPDQYSLAEIVVCPYTEDANNKRVFYKGGVSWENYGYVPYPSPTPPVVVNPAPTATPYYPPASPTPVTPYITNVYLTNPIAMTTANATGVQLGVTAVYSDGSTMDASSYANWTGVSDPSLGSVSSYGWFTPSAMGGQVQVYVNFAGYYMNDTVKISGIVSTIALGGNYPFAVIPRPNTNEMWVLNAGTTQNQVSIIMPDQSVQNIDFGPNVSAGDLIFTPDGLHAYVTIEGVVDEIWNIDCITHGKTLVAAALSGGIQMAMTQDGVWVYFVQQGITPGIYRINTYNDAVTLFNAAPTAPTGIVLIPGWNRMFVADSGHGANDRVYYYNDYYSGANTYFSIPGWTASKLFMNMNGDRIHAPDAATNQMHVIHPNNPQPTNPLVLTPFGSSGQTTFYRDGSPNGIFGMAGGPYLLLDTDADPPMVIESIPYNGSLEGGRAAILPNGLVMVPLGAGNQVMIYQTSHW